MDGVHLDFPWVQVPIKIWSTVRCTPETSSTGVSCMVSTGKPMNSDNFPWNWQKYGFDWRILLNPASTPWANWSWQFEIVGEFQRLSHEIFDTTHKIFDSVMNSSKHKGFTVNFFVPALLSVFDLCSLYDKFVQYYLSSLFTILIPGNKKKVWK